MHIGIFEDHLARHFLPLTYFRPVYDLRCGILTMRQRILAFLPAKNVTLFSRTYLGPLLREENPEAEFNTVPDEPCLLINGRCIMTKKLVRELRKNPEEDCVFVNGDDTVAIRLSSPNPNQMTIDATHALLDFPQLASLKRMEVDATLVAYHWDLVQRNGELINSDFQVITGGGKRIRRSGKVHASAVLVGRKWISIGKKTEIGPGVVLDATNGPIVIGSRVRIYPQAVIEGPCFVGDGAVIKIGAKIYGSTSIGPLCKAGGEVDHSILHACANKQHDGFLGHSYIAPWVNLGAGTTTSNLKNTYGIIKVHVDGRLVDSGEMFVGLTAGDHVKTGINATLDTGSVIGPSSNVYGTTLPPKYIPAFSWGEAGAMETYGVEKALDVAVRVMGRRQVSASAAYQEVFRHVFAITENERTGHTSD